ncbi:PerC family transcriptional regulator [Salmonella enterica]|nr:PerC family transcriptional regulator [Salmonella enterica]EDB5722430.1 PerC family transcriptional regulator [Salmonella enterica subsp. enterica serovar Rubislaw]EDQ1913036.1 PerC family transcriptional regulator [Salmonella enterica subsp. enterica]EDT7595546.1 PerC family transcriptional regulator [Salmonella enterica subsp. enterica serovar Bovismorbificans]ECC5789567.1 PerC family transcriptional regulator [Salmonella enterica]
MPNTKWHLNRSPSGITIDHDLASILHTFIVCGMLADYPGPSTPRFTVFQTDKCWTNFPVTEKFVVSEAEGAMPADKRKTLKLPDDRTARELESRKQWRRAVCRWRYVLTQTEDALTAEYIIWRMAWCRQQLPKKRPDTLILSADDLRHIDRTARKLGCCPIARYWVE